MLSSDILEEQFGPTEITVLHQTDNSRVICTKTKVGQILELSFVSFLKAGIDQFPLVHQAIISGKSMGKAFREHGLKFERQTKATYHDSFPSIFNDSGGERSTVISVFIVAGNGQTPYAEILEVYSPAVVWPADSDI